MFGFFWLLVRSEEQFKKFICSSPDGDRLNRGWFLKNIFEVCQEDSLIVCLPTFEDLERGSVPFIDIFVDEITVYQ